MVNSIMLFCDVFMTKVPRIDMNGKRREKIMGDNNLFPSLKLILKIEDVFKLSLFLLNANKTKTIKTMLRVERRGTKDKGLDKNG